MVVHAGVEEGKHDLFFHESQAMHLGVWFSAEGVVVGSFGHFEPFDFVSHEAEHHFVAFVLIAVPGLAHPLLQLLVPRCQNFEHQIDAFRVFEVPGLVVDLKHLLLLHYFVEVVA